MASFDAHKIGNKLKRQQHQLKLKKQKESAKRDERLRRRRNEDKNPRLREERQAKNVPLTIDRKRVWDDADPETEALGAFGLSVDVLNPKRRKFESDEGSPKDAATGTQIQIDEGKGSKQQDSFEEEGDDDVDSMLGSDSEESEEEADADLKDNTEQMLAARASSVAASDAASEAPSMATDLNLTPDALASRFPSLFNSSDRDPKVLVTTSINSTLHWEAELLTTLFPGSSYVRRTAHFHSYKYSIREISKFASGRDYTHVVVLTEEYKKPKGLDVVHLPDGPMFHFSISNWVEGAKLPGHGNPTNHYPELILNGFRTPLGIVAAHLFKSLFPPRPEIQGRQVVTLHNQRDYIFFRRHRYVFRDKRGSEKSIQGPDGKIIKGVEDIRAGLQELGPRFTLKLRRVDKGIQRASGQEWEWKAHDEKMRTKFSL
nr:ribosome production factor 1 [Quercus suber]